MLTALNASIGANLILTGYAILFIARWIRDHQSKNPRIFDRGKVVLLANASVISLFAMYLASAPSSFVDWTIAFIFFVFFFIGSIYKFLQTVRSDDGGIWISGIFSSYRTRFCDIKGIDLIDGRKLEEQGSDQLVIRTNDGRKIDISGWSYLYVIERLLKSKGVDVHTSIEEFALKHKRFHILGIAVLLIGNLALLLAHTVIC